MRPSSDEKRKVRPSVFDRIMAIEAIPVDDIGGLERAVKRYLADRSPTVRAAAIDFVRKQDLQKLGERIIRLLSDKSHRVRYTAVECLGALHEGEAVKASWLYPLLQDPQYMVRIETLQSLGGIGDKEALPLIAERLRDDHPLVRSYAAGVIAELDGRHYFRLLLRRSEEDEDDIAQVGIAYALFRFGDLTQLSVLLKLLSSVDYRVRCASANSLTDVDLTPAQRKKALGAVSNAARNALAVADRSTMERVEKALRGHS